MPTVSLVDSSHPPASDVVVVGMVSSDDGPVLVPGAERVDEAMGGHLRQALRALGVSAAVDEVAKIPTLGLTSTPLVVAAGLGKTDDLNALDAEAVRRGVGAAIRALGKNGRITIAIGSGTDAGLVEAISDGAHLGAYRFARYKSNGAAAGTRRVDIGVAAPAAADARAALRRSRVITTAVNNTRDLVNTPANDLNPVTFAAYAKEHGEKAALTVEVLGERELRRGGYGGILGVGGGSSTPPRLVRLSYQPSRPKASVALVGKGITFDTGGLNLKTAMMALMKSDMGGAAAVIETVIAAAALRIPVAVTATVPMAENAVSGTSYRPSDVLTMHDGRTVEVADTDAEGRLVLADAILRAVEDTPDYLIETSTLTGGQIVALGDQTAGVMGSDDFRTLVVASGTAAGEALWPMPLPGYLRATLDSPVADIANLPKDRWASMLVGGVFLSDFIPDDLPWVHIDIAGPSFANAANGYTQRGGTGFIVRTMLATLKRIAADAS
jgi:leucyl aminopeptidase